MYDTDIHLLYNILPPSIQALVYDRENIVDIAIDLGRPLVIRTLTDTIYTDYTVTPADIDCIVNSAGPFNTYDRTAIDNALHRISCIYNAAGTIIGFTCRVGRPIVGGASLVEDLLSTGKSLLIVGSPGAGKSTLLRDCARMCADELNRRTVVVDTSNELGGDGDVPHWALGKSRRLQVPCGKTQAETLLRCVGNHMPEVIVIDEISNAADVQAARTIAERGVQLIATAHGKTIQNIIDNPMLSDLVGGVQTVTISDDEARRQDCRKSRMDRKHTPTFDIVIEIVSFGTVKVHMDAAAAVDSILSTGVAPAVVKSLENGKVKHHAETVEPRKDSTIYCWLKGIPPSRVEEIVDELQLPVTVVQAKDDADIGFVLARERDSLPKANMPIYFVESNTKKSINQAFRQFLVDLES